MTNRNRRRQGQPDQQVAAEAYRPLAPAGRRTVIVRGRKRGRQAEIDRGRSALADDEPADLLDDVHRVPPRRSAALLVVGEGGIGVQRDVRHVLGSLLLDLVEDLGPLGLVGLGLLLLDEGVHLVVLVVTEEALARQ